MSKSGKLLCRVRRAFRTPSWRHLSALLVEAAWLLPLLLVLGMAGGLMEWRPSFDATMLRLAVVAIVAPAIGEELLFRVVLLPQPRPDTALPMVPLAASVILFVAWHPIQVLVFGPHWARTVLDPWFLAAEKKAGPGSSPG